MTPSILKYLDVARLLGAGIKCPACQGTRCQPSRWLSKHERMGSQGFRPYRCEDCANRFLAANYASLERTLINGAAGILLFLAVLLAGELGLDSFDAAKAKRVKLASVHSEESTPRVKAMRSTEDKVTDSKENPAELADKLQKTAADGDVGAMLQLGRALAAGDKLPKDVKEAAKWMRLAAATGNAEGMFELGRFYRDGVGLAQDSVRAYAWFSRAAAANHLTAMQERDALVRTMSDEKLKEARELSLSPEPLVSVVRRK